MTENLSDIKQRAANGEFLPFYVPRDHMPQINPEFFQGFLFWASSQGVTPIRHEVVAAETLRAHQRITRRIVHQYAAKIDQTIEIAVSADDYICDGNHRWWAHHLTRTPVPLVRLPLLFDDAIRLMFAYPNVQIDRRLG